MCGPKLDQQVVKFLPFPNRRFVVWGMTEAQSAGGAGEEGDGLKLFGFDSLECGIDPPNSWIAGSKLHFLKTCGFGEIK